MYLRSLAIFWRFRAGLLLISDSSPHSPQNLSLGAMMLLQPGAGPLQFYTADVAKLMRFLNWTLAFGAVQAVHGGA